MYSKNINHTLVSQLRSFHHDGGSEEGACADGQGSSSLDTFEVPLLWWADRWSMNVSGGSCLLAGLHNWSSGINFSTFGSWGSAFTAAVSFST